MMSSLFGYVFLSVYVLYMARELALAPPLIGLILSLGGVGAFVGALLAEPVARRVGVGPAIIGAQFLFGVLGLCVPLAVVVRPVAVPMIATAEFLQWLAYVTYLVSAVSLRQALAPDRLRGRINATTKFLIAGSVPIGGLLGGLLGEVLGLGATLVVGVFGMMLGVVWVYCSPLRAMHDFPIAAEEPVTKLTG
jgi:predicted MFS family arabinose efflux permease